MGFQLFNYGVKKTKQQLSYYFSFTRDSHVHFSFKDAIKVDTSCLIFLF